MIVGIIVIFLAVVLSGCNGSDKDKLVGTWVSTDEDIGSTFRLVGGRKGLGANTSSKNEWGL